MSALGKALLGAGGEAPKRLLKGLLRMEATTRQQRKRAAVQVQSMSTERVQLTCRFGAMALLLPQCWLPPAL
eukprot:2913268-Amphidinium_carterae.1